MFRVIVAALVLTSAGRARTPCGLTSTFRRAAAMFPLLLVFAAPVDAQESPRFGLLRVSQTVVVSGAMADVVSTAGFRRSAGVKEGNPLYTRADGSPHMPRVIAGKSAMALLTVLATESWKKRGHPKVGAALGFAIGAMDWSVAFNNRRLTQRRN